MTELVLHDTRTRRKRRFEPLEPGHARVYTCGPTVYAPQHLGNLRAVLFADLLKRALLAEGLRVTHVINITDVGHLTDDAQLVERLGAPVAIVEGDARNLKITWPEDVAVAEALLAAAGEAPR